jgi:hypothetical protein
MTVATGEITVDVAGADLHGLPGMSCQAIALKRMQEKIFQADLMELVEN